MGGWEARLAQLEGTPFAAQLPDSRPYVRSADYTLPNRPILGVGAGNFGELPIISPGDPSPSGRPSVQVAD
jgi:hypothetical protein